MKSSRKLKKKAKDTKEEKKEEEKKLEEQKLERAKQEAMMMQTKEAARKSPGTAEARGGIIGCGYGRDRDPCKRLPSAGKCVADFE